ncbi:MAG: hypothetical protein NC182_03970 [Prevotella sp.]|nr:hypothetical protein [Staphylococcus sp.]MCM1350337.1 hypothetical protein [Prevotella sp.]
MKKNKDKWVKDLKVYNIVMGNVWKLLTFLLLGVLAGYLFEKYAKDKSLPYMLISILTFTIIGIIDFFFSIIRESKKLEQKPHQTQLSKEQETQDETTPIE